MFCPRCGTRTSDEATACTLCGFVFRPDAEGRSHEPATDSPPTELATPGIAEPGIATPAAPSGAGPSPGPVLVTYGGFWRRLAGCLIDAIITYFPAAIVRVMMGRAATSSFDPSTPAAWVASLFELMFNWLYAAWFISSPLRATLGQQVLDLHVTDLRGQRISFARASGRYFAQILNLLTFGFGLLLQILTPRRQALHDLVTGTVVVRPRRMPAIGVPPAGGLGAALPPGPGPAQATRSMP